MRWMWIALLVVFVAVCGQVGAQEDEQLVRGVSYVGLSVSDMDKALAFYRDACDMKVVEEAMLSGSAVLDKLAGREGVFAVTKMLEGPNAQVRLMQFAAQSDEAKATAPVAVNGPGYMHVCFQVLKEVQTYQRVLEAGAKVIGAEEMAQLNPRRTVYYAYVHDFDGRVVEVEHIDLGERGRTNPPKVKHKVRHICIASADIDGLLEFYTAFLGYEPRQVGPIQGEQFDMVSGFPGTDIRLAWYPIRNFELELNEYLSHPPEGSDATRPIDTYGYNMVVFDVSDVEAAAEKLEAAGGTVITEASEMDGGMIVFARDPDGNLLGLLDAPKDSIVSTSRFLER